MGMRIRAGDQVQVIAGSDKGKQGKVLVVSATDKGRARVRVEGVRMQKRHLKPGRRGARTGGIIEQEGFIDASNVMLVDGSGQPSRFRVETRDGQRVRVFQKSGDVVPSASRS